MGKAGLASEHSTCRPLMVCFVSDLEGMKMSIVTQAIHNHHEEILSHLREYVAELVEQQPGANPAALVEFLQKDLLPHAAGEEAELYPLMDELIRKHGKASATMSVDHEYIQNYVKQIADATSALETANPTEKPELEERLRRLALRLEALLEVHLDKEERVYLPIFEEHSSQAEQEQVLEGMHSANP